MCSGNSSGLTSAGRREFCINFWFSALNFCYFKEIFDPFGCLKYEFFFGFANHTEKVVGGFSLSKSYECLVAKEVAFPGGRPFPCRKYSRFFHLEMSSF